VLKRAQARRRREHPAGKKLGIIVIRRFDVLRGDSIIHALHGDGLRRGDLQERGTFRGFLRRRLEAGFELHL